jgi:hypothetical protein
MHSSLYPIKVPQVVLQVVSTDGKVSNGDGVSSTGEAVSSIDGEASTGEGVSSTDGVASMSA